MALQLQMSWQPSVLSQKRKSGPPLGLKNLGNSCYLNSVLQCLTYTPPLANFCLKHQHSSLCESDSERKRECPFCILEKRIVRSLSVDLALDTPSKIHNCLRIFAEHFRCGRQEDAHEFLRYVIDACHNTCLRLKKLQRRNNSNNGATATCTTVVKEIFGGALQSQVKCLSCGNESNKVDEIMDISLDVLLSNSLREALQKFFQSEVLDGNNKYKCDNCKKLVAARKQMSILQAPNVLVIQLKRFEGIFGGKIDKAIAFEEFLVLSSFMCKASQVKDPRPEYKLFGTIVHSGYSPESGHYYAYIKDAVGRWYCCNDSFVSLSTLKEVLSEKVYILFFSRTNQRSVSASTSLASNGTKSRDCNGSEASKSPNPALQLKPVHAKPYVEQSSQKDTSVISKVGKVPSSQRVKFSIGNSNSKKAPANGNEQVDVVQSQSMEANGDVKESILMEKSEKVVLSSINRNGFNKVRKVGAADSENNDALVLINENGNSQSVDVNPAKPSPCEGNGARSGVTMGKGHDHHGLGTNVVNGHHGYGNSVVNGHHGLGTSVVNGHHGLGTSVVNGHHGSGTSLVNGHHGSGTSVVNGHHGSGTTVVNGHHGLGTTVVNGHSEISGCKRKSQEGSCILLAQDSKSRAEVEELKEALEKEASSILQSSGWSDTVYSFMCSRKRLCAREVGKGPSSSSELKKLLIAEAKPTFISQIPESLKEGLIDRLRTFSQERRHFSEP